MTAITELKELINTNRLTTEQKHHECFYNGLAERVREEVDFDYAPQESDNMSELVDFYNTMLCKSRSKSLNGGW